MDMCLCHLCRTATSPSPHTAYHCYTCWALFTTHFTTNQLNSCSTNDCVFSVLRLRLYSQYETIDPIESYRRAHKVPKS